MDGLAWHIGKDEEGVRSGCILVLFKDMERDYDKLLDSEGLAVEGQAVDMNGITLNHSVMQIVCSVC